MTTSEKPRFSAYDDFIDTPFSRRFQHVLRGAQNESTARIVSAPPRSGKTWSIREFVQAQQPIKQRDGTTRLPVVTVGSNPNQTKEDALGLAIVHAFGTYPQMPWSRTKFWLIDEFCRSNVELLIIDDAHDLSIPQLKFIKYLIDSLAQNPYQRSIGICLIAAAYPDENALVSSLQRPEMLWEQFRGRLDPDLPFSSISANTEQEVRDILAVLEKFYQNQVPQLRLVRWSRAIYQFLTHPTLDPAGTKRVRIGPLINYVRGVVKRAYRRGMDDVTGELLADYADRMASKQFQVTPIEGDPNDDSDDDALTDPLDFPNDASTNRSGHGV